MTAMAKPFFIIALPRSRTAWLSVLLSHRNAFCFHELSSRVADLTEMKAVFERAPYDFVGNCDSLLVKYFPDFRDVFPDAPVLLVKRDPIQVLRSYRKLTGADLTTDARILLDRLSTLTGRSGVMTVDFEHLSDEDTMRQCWVHCLPGMPFDRTRFHEMCGLNVQIDLEGDFFRRISGPSALFFNDAFQGPEFVI